MTDDTDLTIADETDRTALEPVVREGVVILGIVGLTAVAMLLPGIGREFPGTGIALGDLVLALGTLGVVASLFHGVPALRDLVAARLDGPPEVVDDAAAIAGYTAAFVAVLIAYWGFAPALGPLIGVPWVYDVAFLGFALLALGAIAYRFARAVDPLTRFLTAELLGTDRGSSEGGSGEEASG